MTTKPVILTDLDDTLFQTKRKMTQEQALTCSAPVRLTAHCSHAVL